MQAVFIDAKEWFDKTYGNSYFSARIYVDNQEVGVLPFQYGYGSMYQYKAAEFLAGYLKVPARNLSELKQEGVIVYHTIKSAKKQEVKAHGNTY